MRIGLVCPYDLSKPGGVQGQVVALSRYLQESGDRVSVIAPGLPADIDGVNLGGSVSIPGNRSRVPVSIDPRVLTRMREVSAGLDLLHVHEPLIPVTSFSALRVGLPIVATFHAAPGRLGAGFYSVFRSRLRRVLGPNVRRVTAVSKTAAAPLPDDLEVTIVPNGVDVDSFGVEVERNPLRVAFLGRDEKRKGLDVLLEAWKETAVRVPGSELYVMGANRGLDGVTWLGPVDDEAKVVGLASAAIYVAPHLGGESFGVVLVEAMAAGCAVVASDLRAFCDVGGAAVRYFRTGDVASLAGVLVGLLQHPSAVAELASAGAKRARRYDWTVVADQYQQVYQSALS